MKDKMGKYKYFLKNTLLLTISNFSSKILVFLLVPIYTSALSTSEYGTYDLISTTISLFLPIVTLNICEAVMRFLMDKNVNKKDVVSIGIRIILLALLFTGMIIVGNDFFSLWDGMAEYSTYVYAFFAVNLLYQFAIQMAKGFEDVRGVAIAGLLSTVLTVACNIWFLIGLNLHLKGFYLAYIIGQFVPFAFLFFKLKIYDYFKLRTDGKVRQIMIAYSVPLIFNSLGWWVNSVSDRYVVTWICGLSINGIYSVSYKIPSILNTVQNIFNQSWQISAIKEYDSEAAGRFYENILYYLNALMVLVCSILVILSKLIASFLYSNDFFAAWKFVPFLLVSGVINSAAGVIGPILSAANNTKALGKSAMYGAGINIVLNIIGVYLLGAQGAAIATAVSSFVIFECRKKAASGLLYSGRIKLIYFSWLILVVQSIVMIMFDTIIGYIGQAVILVIFLILYKKIIIDLCKRIVRKIESKR